MANSKRKSDKENSRIVALGEITNESICEILEQIYEINEEDKNKEVSKRDPIKLILNSPGGDVYDGIGLIDAIEQSETPIHIYVQDKLS